MVEERKDSHTAAGRCPPQGVALPRQGVCRNSESPKDQTASFAQAQRAAVDSNFPDKYV